MDFLEKLNYLMHENNLNKSTLSKACEIPYTTIDGWYKKGYQGGHQGGYQGGYQGGHQGGHQERAD